MHRHFARLPLCGVLAWALCIAPTLRAQERVDVATIDRITSEAMGRSQVMDIMSWLSDVYGPRLTWSPNAARAGAWAAAQMQSWGLENVHEERWDSPAARLAEQPLRLQCDGTRFLHRAVGAAGVVAWHERDGRWPGGNDSRRVLR